MKDWQVAGLLVGGAALAYLAYRNVAHPYGGSEGLNTEMGIVHQNGTTTPLYSAASGTASAGSVMVNNTYIALTDYFYCRFWLNLKPVGSISNVSLQNVHFSLTKTWAGPQTFTTWNAGTDGVTGRPVTSPTESWITVSLPVNQLTAVDLKYRDNLAANESATALRPFSAYDSAVGNVIRTAILDAATDYTNLTPGTYTLTCTCTVNSLTYAYTVPGQGQQTQTVTPSPSATTATFTIVVGPSGGLQITVVGSQSTTSGGTPSCPTGQHWNGTQCVPDTTPTTVTIGDTNIEPNKDGVTQDFIGGSRALVTQNCTTQTMSFYCGVAGSNAVLSIYSDNNGAAATQLCQSAPFALVAGWNTVQIPAVALTSGSYVWLCWTCSTSVAPSGSEGWRYKLGGSTFFAWNSYSSGLPLSLAGWGNYEAGTYSIYVTCQA
jgi:hypothetical protein